MEGNSSNNSSSLQLQIAYTVASSIGVLISCFLLLGVLLVKAFRSFLQRVFIIVVVVTLSHDVIKIASSIYHKNDDDVHEKSCMVLALLFQWLHWSLYLSFTAAVIYLLVIVHIQSKPNSRYVVAIRNSQLFRAVLEVGVVLFTMMSPWAIIWVPYIRNQYGFDGITCAIIVPPNSTTGDVFVSLFYKYAPMEIFVFFAGVSALGMALVYCGLSPTLKHARNVIRKLLISVLVIFVYFLLLNLQVIGRNSNHNLSVRIFLVFWHVMVKFSVLFGYLFLFHCSNLHDQIKKFGGRKKVADDHAQNSDNEKGEKEYGTFEDSSRKTPPSNTYFSVPYTGDFTTVSSKV